MAQVHQTTPGTEIEGRRAFYKRFMTITTVFTAHVIVLVAIVLALISHGHH